MQKVLFVCMGNICRSPTAEGIANKLLKEKGLEEAILIQSAGTHGYHIGKAPDKRSQATAMANGVNLSGIRAQQIALSDFKEYDYIVAMDSDNLRNLQSLCPNAYQAKLSLLLSYTNAGIQDVPDPYYGDDQFQQVFQLIESGVDAFLESIIKK